MFLVEGALYYERGTKLSEPNALNTPLLVTVGPNSGDDIVIMMSGAYGNARCVSINDSAYCAAGTANIGSCASRAAGSAAAALTAAATGTYLGSLRQRERGGQVRGDSQGSKNRILAFH